MLLVVIILTSVFLDVSVSSEPLKVCSFNVQVFGANKSRNANVMRILGKVRIIRNSVGLRKAFKTSIFFQIFSKYDLCLMQEIRDTRNSSITALLKQINGYAKEACCLPTHERARLLLQEYGQVQCGCQQQTRKVQQQRAVRFLLQVSLLVCL